MKKIILVTITMLSMVVMLSAQNISLTFPAGGVFNINGSPGTDGQVLTSKGLGVNPLWADVAEADLRFVGTNNHITQDAGVGGTGTSAGTGANNIAIGSGTGNALTSGSFNAFIGADAGAKTTTGVANTVLGYVAMPAATNGIGNLALGAQTLTNFTSGNENTAVGGATLNSLSTGNYNVALGVQAGEFLQSGSKNIIIGHEVSFPDVNGSNQLNIGNIIYGINVDGSYSSISSGNIGIGTKTPGSRLAVVGLPTYADNTAATGGGLVAGDFYRTATGVLMVTY